MSSENDMVTSDRVNVAGLCVTPGDLARLLSRSSGTICYWSRQRGLPRRVDGLYNVKAALLWLEAYYKAKRPPVRVAALMQEQLSAFLGESRQWIIARTQRDALPRRIDGLYDLRAVCAWLPGYYRKLHERDYERRLAVLRKKVGRNAAQLHKFLAGGKSK